MVIKNSKGQMAIFFVLIFQILFILFAMTLNVALVVHDKINLQNSLDLAAMYGSKKQAEVLNAIAHINYQMRQNYKLLAWRYRVLGSLTLKNQSIGIPDAWCPKGGGGLSNDSNCRANADDSPFCNNSIYPNNYCDKQFFICISSPIWLRGVGGTTDYCKKTTTTIPRIPDVPVIAPFFPLNQANTQRNKLARDRVGDNCENETGTSSLITQIFLTHFRLDQKDRKIMIQAIYNKTLKLGRDLDGNSIDAGAEKVFRKNLTYTNRKNYNPPTFYNSFNGKDFKEFLKPLNIFPILQYLEIGGKGNNCTGTVKDHTSPADDGGLFSEFYREFNTYFRYNENRRFTPDNHFGILTLGYKKNADLTLYYGAKAEFPYSNVLQLFSPGTSVFVLKSSSFAKPFGGRIGPDEEADKILKAQIDFAALGPGLSEQSIVNLQPNYSRYPGDKWGLIDVDIHKIGGKAFLKKTAHPDTEVPTPYDISLFDHLNVSTRADPLASADNNPDHFLRIMELMAVFPDVFDITHYSISNNYMETYFDKICSLIGQNNRKCDPRRREAISFPSRHIAYIRGDFGYPDSLGYLQKNLQSTKIANSFVPFFFAKDKNPVNLRDRTFQTYTNQNIRYPWLISDPAHFLTSWAPPTKKERYQDYSFPEKMFAKCYSHTSGSSVSELLPTPSGCEQGGRSGYSIKTISCNLVATLQPQPNNLREFCP